MRYVASREEMQQIDAYSINTMGIPGIVLMEKAALALEEVFLELSLIHISEPTRRS